MSAPAVTKWICDFADGSREIARVAAAQAVGG